MIKVKILIILVFLNFLCLVTAIHSAYSDEGETLYKNKKYKKALNYFLKKQIDNPDLPELKYNTANTYYNLDDFSNAEKEYLGVLQKTKDKALKQQAYFNLGNTYYKQGKLNESLEFYKKVLTIDKNDKDAKYNMEFVMKEIKKRKEESKKNKDKKDDSKEDKKEKGDEEKKDNEKSSDSGSNDEKQDKEKEDKQSSSEEKQNKKDEAEEKESKKGDGEDSNSGNRSESAKEGGKPLEEITEKEAIKWLDRVKEDRTKFIQKQIRKKGKVRSPKKDW